jgi:hypothetical protein
VWDVVYEHDGFHPYDISPDRSIVDDVDFGTSTLFPLGNTVSGAISGTWDGIYSVSGNVNVPAGETLVINPGTRIQFLGNYHFDVLGELQAVGAEGDEIVFTTLRRNQAVGRGYWQGIDFEDSSDDSSLLKHTVVEYAVDGVYWNHAKATLENFVIRECSNNGLYFNNDGSDGSATDGEVFNCSNDGVFCYIADPTLTRINIHNNSRFGMFCDNGAHAQTYDCEFVDNSSHGVLLQRSCSVRLEGARVHSNSSWGIRMDQSWAVILDAVVTSNSGYGLCFNHDHATYRWIRIEDSRFEDNTSYGIYLRHNARQDSIIRNTTVRHNGSHGVLLDYYCGVQFEDNLVTENNGAGLYFANRNHNRVVNVVGNVFAYNLGDGIYKHTGNTSSPNILYNTFYQNNGDGIELNATAGTNTLIGNIIVDNGGYGLRANTTVHTFDLNNVYENGAGAIANSGNLPGNTLELPLSTVNANGTPADNYLNIIQPPGFTLNDSEDFSLLPTSAAVDAGSATEVDPDGSSADLGGVYRDHGNPHTVSVDSEVDTEVGLSWQAVITDLYGELTGYNIYKRLAGTEDPFVLDSSVDDTVTTAVIDSLTNGTDYEFTVTAEFDSGAAESPHAPPVIGTPGVPAISLDPAGLNVVVDEDPKAANLTIENTGTRDLDVDVLLGAPSGSARFTGSNDYLRYGTGSHLTGMTAFTMEAWVYLESDGHLEFMGRNYREWSLYISSASNRFGMYKGIEVDPNDVYHDQYQNWTTPYSVPKYEWHHLAVAWEGNTITFYADGEVIETYGDVVETAVPNRGYNFEIGRRSHEGNYFNGNLAEVRVWAVRRSQEQIKRWMHSPLQGDETGLRGYWPLHANYNDATGSTSVSTTAGTAIHSRTAPMLPKLALSVDKERFTIAPGANEVVAFSFPDSGSEGTHHLVSPLLTNIVGDNTDQRFDDAPRNALFYEHYRESGPRYKEVEMALTYGSPVLPNPVHFNGVTETALPYTILITGAVLDEQALVNGDEIGVFDGEDLVGAALYDGSYNLLITAYESEGGPGFVAGNQMTFRIYDDSSDQEAVTALTYEIGDGTFGYGVFSALSLDGTVFETQAIPLEGGRFNMVSFNKLPRFSSADTVFGDVTNLSIVHNDRGSSLIPGYGIDSLIDIDFKDGYHLYTADDQTLYFEGNNLTPADHQITLEHSKWNTISFLGSGLQDVTTAFADIDGSISMVKTVDGAGNLKVWDPGNVINTIVNLEPGLAYQVAITGSVDLQFAYNITGAAGARSAKSASPAVTAFNPVASTGMAYVVIVSNLTVDGIAADAGTEVGLFDGDLCVGAGVWQGESIAIAAWKAYAAEGLAGYAPGNDISVRVAGLDGEVSPGAANFLQGDGTFDGGLYAIASVAVGSLGDPPVVEAVEVVDSSQPVAGVTRQRLVHLSITAADAENLSFLVTESSAQPAANAAGWSASAPDTYEIQGDAGEVTLYVWARDAAGQVSLLHSGSQQQIVLDEGLTFSLVNNDGSELTFGEWTYATNGIDAGVDLPIVTAARSLDLVSPALAYFESTFGDLGESFGLLSDIRPTGDVTRWRLRVDEAVETTLNLVFEVRLAGIPIAVDLSELLEGRQIVLQQLDGETTVGAPVPLAHGVALDLAADTVYEIALAEPAAAQVGVDAGWNLISLPTMTDATVADLFGDDELGALFAWDRGRLQPVGTETVLSPEVGYWINAESAAVSELLQGIVADGRISPDLGWSLIGPSVRSEPGLGYWIFSATGESVDLIPTE